jgi:hypothetical protein
VTIHESFGFPVYCTCCLFSFANIGFRYNKVGVVHRAEGGVNCKNERSSRDCNRGDSTLGGGFSSWSDIDVARVVEDVI